MRIGLGPEYSPLASWILAQAPAGQAWGWLRWQSGKYWWDSYATAAFGAMLAEPDSGAWSERYAPLLRAARVRRLLLPERAPPPPAPWQRANGDGRFALWEQPDVSPVAVGYSAWRVWDGEPGRAEAAAAVEALREDEITVSPPATTSGGPQRGPIAVAYRRPTPEWIRLALDAGSCTRARVRERGLPPRGGTRTSTARPRPCGARRSRIWPCRSGPASTSWRCASSRPRSSPPADVVTTNAWIALAVWLIWRKFPPGGLRKLRELARRPEHPLWDEMHRPRTERPRAARQDRNQR
jgi:hypothetical protein